MGRIYSIACRTIIYLGESSEQSESVFTEVGRLFSGNRAPIAAERIYSKFDEAALERLRNSVQAISRCPWFTRAWIFQELLLSRDPWV